VTSPTWLIIGRGISENEWRHRKNTERVGEVEEKSTAGF